MTWGEFKRMVDEHIDDSQRLGYITFVASQSKLTDIDWNEDGTVDITS